MIKPVCDMCGIELDRFGGLLFSPPGRSGKVRKYHICNLCFKKLESDIRQ